MARGYFEGSRRRDSAGARYRTSDRERASGSCIASQPDGVHAPSEVVDPDFAWNDHGWRRGHLLDVVVYELHVGTFTRRGHVRRDHRPSRRAEGARRHRDRAHAGRAVPGRPQLGIRRVVRCTPRRARTAAGRVEAPRRRGHARGLAVVLDVVYNHLGPEGNYLSEFGRTSPTATGRRGGSRSTSMARERSRSRGSSSRTRCSGSSEFHIDGAARRRRARDRRSLGRAVSARI